MKLARAAKILAVLSASLASACAGGGAPGPSARPDPVPVFLPGERVECLFEVMGTVTVRGPFRARDNTNGGPREAMLRGVRLEVGREAAVSGAHAAMVREFMYARDPASDPDRTPEIIAVEAMLLSFVDPACVLGE